MGNRSSRKGKRKSVEHPPEADEDWILECVVGFVQSAECSVFVEGFIDEKCLVFDNDFSDAQHNRIHVQYKEMVEHLLCTHLSKLGIKPAQYMEAICTANRASLSAQVLQYIDAVHDFAEFKDIMTQRNILLEQQAIKYLSQQSNKEDKSFIINQEVLPNMTEEEQIAIAVAQSQSCPQPPIQPAKEDSVELASAPALSSDDMSVQLEGQPNGEHAMDNMTNIHVCKPNHVSLKPLKIQKNGDDDEFKTNAASNSEVEDLPALSKDSIEDIKIKQSVKEMLLDMRKEERHREMECMNALPSARAKNQAALPPLSKSLFKNAPGKGTAEGQLQ